jgi:integrase-like protein
VWHFIESGKPMQNALTESFNEKFWGEFQYVDWFIGLVDGWRITLHLSSLLIRLDELGKLG